MKKVVSVSLGSSKRNHSAVAEFLGEKLEIARMGTDGDFKRAVELIKELDGKVDAIGLGGIDVYLYVKDKRYAIRDGRKLMEAARVTPVVDGSGLKNTLEREVVRLLARETGLLKKGTKVLMVSSVDRFGMAQTFWELGCEVVFGDLIFALGIPCPIRSMKVLEILARIVLPVITLVPFQVLYPTGKKQEAQDEAGVKKFARFYHWAEVIAGDFHFIRRYMPHGLKGQVILTNTTTKDDIEFVRERGAGVLVTTTPEFGGRTFGTNVMEAALVALLKKPPVEITPGDYLDILKKLGFRPRIIDLRA